MLPGSLLRYHEKIQGSLLSLLLQYAPFLSFSAVLLDPGSRPKCCSQCADAQLTCWERVLSFNSMHTM